MLLPKGIPLYQRLDTAFTNLRELLRALKESKFYGYVEVQFPGYQGILLCDAGDVVTASEEAEGQLRTGKEAVAGVLARASERGGEITVMQLSADLVYHWAARDNSRPIHKDLSTEFTRLDKLVADLTRQRHTGHMEVLFRTGGMGLLFLDEGEIVQSLCGGPDETTITDRPALQRILERANQAGATINVYRSTGAPLPRTDPAAVAALSQQGPDPFEVLGGLLGELEAAVDSLAGRGAFAMALRRAQEERSQEYPFLDPFEGLFQFKDGRATFGGEEGAEVVIPALRDCLAQALDALCADPALAPKGLRGQLHAVASARTRDLPADFQAWGFDVGLLAPGG